MVSMVLIYIEKSLILTFQNVDNKFNQYFKQNVSHLAPYRS